MAAGKEHYQSLLELYRLSEYRRFCARSRNNRWAEFLGVGPTGKMLGWYEGSDVVQEFDPHQINWCQLTTYV